MTTTSPRPAAPPPARTGPGDRDPWFDNAKLILVTLVVVGHAWALLPATGVYGWLYDYLYLWHMPAFLVLTGYLSRTFDWSNRHFRRLFTSVLVPFVVFEAALVLFRRSITGAEYDNLWIEPHWPMWFLLALLLWRLATPLLQRLPHPMVFAVAVSLVGGLFQFDLLQLDRVFGFLPFFVLGLIARPEHVERLRTRRVRLWGLGVILAATVVPVWVNTQLRTEWLYYRSGYDTLGFGAWEGVGVRAVLLVVSTALALSFLAWLPARRGRLTAFGAASLVVYLFHGFFIKGAEYAGFPAWAEEHAVLGLILTTALGTALALLLAAPPIARRLGWVVDPASQLEAASRADRNVS